jgi:outer membrane protein
MRFPLMVLSLFFLAVAAPAQQTLPECVRIALANNPGLKMAESEAGIAREDVVQARAAQRPALDFSGSYRRQSAVPELNIDVPLPIPIFQQGGFKLGSLDNSDLRLTVTQPLFTGFRLRQGKAAAEAVSGAKMADLKRQSNELIFKVESAYAAVLQAQQGAEIARSARSQIAAHLSDVETMVAQGLARRDERLRVEVKATEADLALLRAENGVALATAALENLLSVPLPEGDEFAEISPGDFEPGDLEQSLQMAAANRPELASLAQIAKAGQAGKKIARGSRLPSLAGFATLGYGKPGLDFIKNEWMDYWLVGVGAEWNLWNWGKTGSKIEQAELRLQGIAASERQLRDAIFLDVKQAHLRLAESAKRLQVAARLAEQAQASFAVAGKQFQQVQASHTDFFDAQSELTRALLQKAEAQIESALARANWRRAVGLSVKEYSNPE